MWRPVAFKHQLRRYGGLTLREMKETIQLSVIISSRWWQMYEYNERRDSRRGIDVRFLEAKPYYKYIKHNIKQVCHFVRSNTLLC